MDIRILQAIVVAVALGLLLGQTAVRHKQTVHIVFAVFCGSIAMMMAKRLGADSLGPYQYLLGLGACATCNGYWLVARALFRHEQAVTSRHQLIAGSVALLLMSDQGLTLLTSTRDAPIPMLLPTHAALNAVMALLSSCLLVLAGWEGCRGWAHASRRERQQRLLFLGCYGMAVLGTTVVKAVGAAVTDPTSRTVLIETAIALAALLMLVVTQLLLVWRTPAMRAVPEPSADDAVSVTIAAARLTDSAVRKSGIHEPVARETVVVATAATASPVSSSLAGATVSGETATEETTAGETVQRESDRQLAAAIHALLHEQKRFLQPDLKVAELARHFAVPEYRISRAIHSHFAARNFNQLINTLRVAHAQTLLADPATQHWPVLVIGLESGFASVGPFNRAFKALVGCTPGEYRQRTLQAQTTAPHTINACPI